MPKSSKPQVFLIEGLKVRVIPKVNTCPDSIFVEDISISTKDFAMVTNPPVPSRNKEKQHIIAHLKSHFGDNNPDYPIYFLAETPEEEKKLAFEGGNVIRFGAKHFYVGINDRTNMEGFNKFQQILKKVDKGYHATAVPMLDPFLHLKCMTTYLGNGVLIGNKEMLGKYKAFENVKIFDTAKLGNCLNVVSFNKNVFIQTDASDELEKELQKMGYTVYRTCNDEFFKVDGDITCRSLII